METLKQHLVQVTIAGRNVTADVTPYLSQVGYNDKEEAESDDIALICDDAEGRWQQGWYPQQGDTLTVTIGSPEAPLDCGLFEIDEIELELAPDQVTVKGIAAAVTRALRTRNSKAFEKQTLRQIAQYFATKHGLRLTGDETELQRIEVDRKTQERQTDLSFLAGLGSEYDIVFSVRGDQLIFIDRDALDAQPEVLTFAREELSKGRFIDKTSQTYGEASVASREMKTNSVHRWTYTPAVVEDQKGTLSKEVWQGETTATTSAQAQAQARAGLRNNNRDKVTGSITVPGNVRLVAGINIRLTGVGAFSGKWHVISSSHTVNNADGYVTTATIRRIGA